MMTDKKKHLPESPKEELSPALQSVKDWIEDVKFRKCTFGGVDEADVWKKIGELNALYEAAFAEERARNEAVVKEKAKVMARQIVRQMSQKPTSGTGEDS